MILTNDNDQLRIEIHAYIYRQFRTAHEKILKSRLFVKNFKDKRVYLLSFILGTILIGFLVSGNKQSLLWTMIEILIAGLTINFAVAQTLAKKEYDQLKNSLEVKKELDDNIISYMKEHHLTNIHEGTNLKVVYPQDSNWVEVYVVRGHNQKTNRIVLGDKNNQASIIEENLNTIINSNKYQIIEPI